VLFATAAGASADPSAAYIVELWPTAADGCGAVLGLGTTAFAAAAGRGVAASGRNTVAGLGEGLVLVLDVVAGHTLWCSERGLESEGVWSWLGVSEAAQGAQSRTVGGGGRAPAAAAPPTRAKKDESAAKTWVTPPSPAAIAKNTSHCSPDWRSGHTL